MKRLNFDILDKNHDVTAYERHYTSSLLSTRQRRNSSPAISTSWPQPWSRDQASAYDWRNTPSELCDFHSQSQGRCWYVRTALETLSTQIGGGWSASRAKENYWTLLESEFDSGSTSHLSVYLTAWSQQLYRDDKCTKKLLLYSVCILPVNYKRIMNRHARRIYPSTHVLTTVDTELAGETFGLRRRRSVLLNTFTLLVQTGFCGCTADSGGTTGFWWCICRILWVHLGRNGWRSGCTMQKHRHTGACCGENEVTKMCIW